MNDWQWMVVEFLQPFSIFSFFYFSLFSLSILLYVNAHTHMRTHSDEGYWAFLSSSCIGVIRYSKNPWPRFLLFFVLSMSDSHCCKDLFTMVGVFWEPMFNIRPQPQMKTHGTNWNFQHSWFITGHLVKRKVREVNRGRIFSIIFWKCGLFSLPF